MQILTFPYLTKKLFLKISSTNWKTLNIIVWIFWITSASYRQLPIVFYVDVNWIITWDQHKCFDLITQTLYTHFKNCSIVLFKYLLISTCKSVKLICTLLNTGDNLCLISEFVSLGEQMITIITFSKYIFVQVLKFVLLMCESSPYVFFI